MPSAKSDFIDRIRCLNLSISSAAVTNRALAETEHNNIAKMLRNGLAVVSFAALEDFIKKRSAEAMSEISTCSVPFNQLPEKLQNSATYGVVSALAHQLNLRDRQEKVAYVQAQALKIASTATSNYDLPDHTFAYGQANVTDKVIGEILKSFNIEDPWRQMSAIASSAGLTALPLVESYKNAAQRRHKAAHIATTDTPQNDIAQFVKEAFAIALGFDALISKSIQKFRENDARHISGSTKVTAAQIEFRVVKFSDGYWKEYANRNTRAHRREASLDILRPVAKGRACSSKQLYIELDESGLIAEWQSY